MQLSIFDDPKCRDPGLNQGPSDLQSDALPTELSRLEIPKKCHFSNFNFFLSALDGYYFNAILTVYKDSTS